MRLDHTMTQTRIPVGLTLTEEMLNKNRDIKMLLSVELPSIDSRAELKNKLDSVNKSLLLYHLRAEQRENETDAAANLLISISKNK